MVVPSGGIFVIPAMSKPMIAVIALVAGSLVTGILLAIIKKPLTNEEVNEIPDENQDNEKDVDLSGVNLQ